MKRNRAYASMLMAAVLVTGLALGTPLPARANDTGAFIAGAVLGVLLDNVFDRDYPRGFSFGSAGGYGDVASGPAWFSWPEAGIFALPEYARPFPYGQRWWEFAGTFRGRPTFVPADREPFGYRELVGFPDRPIFVQPRYVSQWAGPPQSWGAYARFGNRWDQFGQYGWAPRPALREYRVPSGGLWYNGPDPDDRRPGHEQPRPNGPEPRWDGRPGPSGQDRWDPKPEGRPGQTPQGHPGQTGQDRRDPKPGGRAGQTPQGRPGQTGQDRRDPKPVGRPDQTPQGHPGQTEQYRWDPKPAGRAGQTPQGHPSPNLKEGSPHPPGATPVQGQKVSAGNGPRVTSGQGVKSATPPKPKGGQAPVLPRQRNGDKGKQG